MGYISKMPYTFTKNNQAAGLERMWQKEVKANELAARQGWRMLRSGFAMTD